MKCQKYVIAITTIFSIITLIFADLKFCSPDGKILLQRADLVMTLFINVTVSYLIAYVFNEYVWQRLNPTLLERFLELKG